MRKFLLGLGPEAPDIGRPTHTKWSVFITLCCMMALTCFAGGIVGTAQIIITVTLGAAIVVMRKIPQHQLVLTMGYARTSGRIKDYWQQHCWSEGRRLGAARLISCLKKLQLFVQSLLASEVRHPVILPGRLAAT